MILNKENRRLRIKRRIRKIIDGTAQRPRLSVFRSNTQIYAQIIDDSNGKTLVSASSLKDANASKLSGVEQAKFVGKAIADKAVAAGIVSVVFDRSGYLYHGRIKSLAESAREGGLQF